MRTSGYNIYVKLTGMRKYLIIHGYTGALDLIDLEIAEALKNENLKTLDEKEIKYLSGRGYLTDKNLTQENERVCSIAEILARFEKQHLSVSFFVTYECNFRCSYCYQERILNSRRNSSGKKFSKEVTDAAYSLIDGLIEPGPGRRIMLYGGEPFLKKNSEEVHYIVKTGIEKGYGISAVSNGYELEEFRDILGRGMVDFIQVTVDGFKDVHNKRRPHFSGAGTFEKVIDNISLALYMGTKINLRINVDKNNIYELDPLVLLLETTELIYDRNFYCYLSPTFIHTRTPVDNGIHGKLCPGIEALLESSEVYELMEELKKKNPGYNKLNPPESYIKDFVKTALSNGNALPFRGNFCGATGNNLILDPAGDIYSCFELIGSEENKIGSFFPKVNKEKIYDHPLTERKIYNLKKCAACKYALFCGGGCAASVKNKSGDIMKSFCAGFPEMFERYAAEALKEKGYIIN